MKLSELIQMIRDNPTAYVGAEKLLADLEEFADGDYGQDIEVCIKGDEASAMQTSAALRRLDPTKCTPAELPSKKWYGHEVLPGAPMRHPRGVTLRNTADRIGRNAQCPCGSGAKFKKCCGCIAVDKSK